MHKWIDLILLASTQLTSSFETLPSEAFIRDLNVSRMSLADYLAKRYLTADSIAEKRSKRSKKRKRKDGMASGFTIEDDDALGWDHDRIGGIADDEGPLEGEEHVSFCHY